MGVIGILIDIQTIVEMVKFVRKLSTVHPFTEVVG